MPVTHDGERLLAISLGPLGCAAVRCYDQWLLLSLLPARRERHQRGLACFKAEPDLEDVALTLLVHVQTVSSSVILEQVHFAGFQHRFTALGFCLSFTPFFLSFT